MSTPKYIAIALDSFMAGSVVTNDVYIKLDDANFVKLWKKGQTFDKERLDRYADQNIDTVYMADVDFQKFASTCLRVGEVISQRKGVPSINKISVMNQIAVNVMASFSQMDFDQDVFRTTETFMNSMVSSLGSDIDIVDLVKSFESLGDDFIKGAVSVSTLSVMLSQCMGWNGSRTLKMLGMAGLLHDIGYKELPSGLYNKKRAEMEPEEVELYESHPERGAKILESLKSVPPEVINIVRDHHEESSGMGFPRRLKLDRIYPLSRVIFVADKLSDYIVPSHRNDLPKSPREAVILILELYSRDLKTEMVKGLHKLVGLEFKG